MAAEVLSIHLSQFKTEAMTWSIENEKNTFKDFYAIESLIIKMINYRVVGCTSLNKNHSLLHHQTAFYYAGLMGELLLK